MTYLGLSNRFNLDLSEQRKNTEDSATIARDAVALDLGDGDSWYVLGNAQLAVFFITPSFSRQSELQKALAAYSKASSASVLSADNKLDLHYNKAMVYTFMQQYSEALDSFKVAAEMQSDWKEPVLAGNALKECIRKIHSSVEKKAGIKPKPLHAIVSKLPATATALPSPINTYGAVGSFDSLTIGANPSCVLPVAVVGFASTAAEVPLYAGDSGLFFLVGSDTWCFVRSRVLVCVDNQGNFGSVSVYNLNREVVAYGSQLTILDPSFVEMSVDLDNTVRNTPLSASNF